MTRVLVAASAVMSMIFLALIYATVSNNAAATTQIPLPAASGSSVDASAAATTAASPPAGAVADALPPSPRPLARRITLTPVAQYTWLANLTGGPAVSVPCGFTAGGLALLPLASLLGIGVPPGPAPGPPPGTPPRHAARAGGRAPR